MQEYNAYKILLQDSNGNFVLPYTGQDTYSKQEIDALLKAISGVDKVFLDYKDLP